MLFSVWALRPTRRRLIGRLWTQPLHPNPHVTLLQTITLHSFSTMSDENDEMNIDEGPYFYLFCCLLLASRRLLFSQETGLCAERDAASRVVEVRKR